MLQAQGEKMTRHLNQNRPRIIQEQSGAVAILVVLVLSALIGFGGLAIDSGYQSLLKGQLQVAADSAALAGAGNLDLTAGGLINARNFAVAIAGRKRRSLNSRKVLKPSIRASRNSSMRCCTRSSAPSSTRAARTTSSSVAASSSPSATCPASSTGGPSSSRRRSPTTTSCARRMPPLREVFGPGYRLESSLRETHVTPSGATQAFVFAVFQRVGALPG